MSKYMIQVFVETDKELDETWASELVEEKLKDLDISSVEVQELKKELAHVSIVYITRPLNLEEWMEFGDKQDDVIQSVIGDDAFVMAGPLPEEIIGV